MEKEICKICFRAIPFDECGIDELMRHIVSYPLCGRSFREETSGASYPLVCYRPFREETSGAIYPLVCCPYCITYLRLRSDYYKPELIISTTDEYSTKLRPTMCRTPQYRRFTNYAVETIKPNG